jgi:quinol monooxygenase YgiN
MTIIIRAELRFHPGRHEKFVEVATALAEAATDEPGTLRYDWYSSADPAVFVVIEEYIDPAAALAHNAHCEAHLRRVPEVADITSAHIHGDLGPDFEVWVAGNPVAHAHPPLRPT